MRIAGTFQVVNGQNVIQGRPADYQRGASCGWRGTDADLADYVRSTAGIGFELTEARTTIAASDAHDPARTTWSSRSPSEPGSH